MRKQGARGLFVGGLTTPDTIHDTIAHVIISIVENATDFGDLATAKSSFSSASNGKNDRGVFAGGYAGGASYTNEIAYIKISHPSNSSDFGDMAAAIFTGAGTSNGTNNRGIFGGGYTSVSLNSISYVTITTPGDAADFGDLTETASSHAALSNATNNRGLFICGFRSDNYSNVIDYVTINSAGDATDFGDGNIETYYIAGTSNGTNNRGVYSLGVNNADAIVDNISYVNIAAPGNAVDFGDLSGVRADGGATSSGTSERALFASGLTDVLNGTNIIEYITINSTGNASDFGDLTISDIRSIGAVSNA